MKPMAPFATVHAAFTLLVRDTRLSVEQFGALASELWHRSGWTADEYKAMARGDVIVIDAEVV